MAEVDPNQEAALRRLRAAFGFSGDVGYWNCLNARSSAYRTRPWSVRPWGTKIHKSGGLPRAQLDDSALGNRLRSVTGEHLVAKRIAARECAAGKTPL